MRWSQLKKRIEDGFAESVKGRVKLYSMKYRKFSDGWGNARIEIDGQQIIDMNSVKFSWEQRKLEGQGKKRKVAEEILKDDNLISQWDFTGALYDYLNMSIRKIQLSDDPVIRAIGMLDNRLGKRRLAEMDITTETDLVKILYLFRCESEGVPVTEDVDYYQRIDKKWLSPKSKKNLKRAQKADSKLKLMQSNSVALFINKIVEQRIDDQNLHGEFNKELHKIAKNLKDQEFTIQVLKYLEKRTKLVTSIVYLKGIFNLIEDIASWKRDIYQWKPKSKNVAKQFTSLLRVFVGRI